MRGVVLALLLVSLGLFVAPAAGAPDAAPETATDNTTVEVVVVFEPGGTNASVITAQGGNVTGGEDVTLLPVLFARVPSAAMEAIERHPSIRYVERDGAVETDAQSTPWGVDRIRARTAASGVDRSALDDVQVAVVDTGIDYDHPDLNASIAWGIDTSGSGEPDYGVTAADDGFGHGTHVAGTVGALDNDIGVVGVAPGVELYAVKVMFDNGTGTYSDLIEGIDAAVSGPDGTVGNADDADVITMSLGGSQDSQMLQDTLEAAAEHAVLIASAGNSGDGDVGTNNVSYPAKYDSVIAVAATDTSDDTPGWSSEGAEVELAAPGSGIESTIIGGYDSKSGTSMAAPHIAGTAALVIAEDLADGQRSLSPAEVRTVLQEAAIDLAPDGRDAESGYGLIDAADAVGVDAVSLQLTANRTAVPVGDAVAFTVTRADTGDPVDATVSADGSDYSTGTDGTVAVTFETVGDVTVTASKSATDSTTFEDDSVTVSVERQEVALDLAANRTTIGTGDRVRFTTTRVDTGEPVSASLQIGSTTHQTDSDGHLAHSFDSTGEYQVTASKADTATETYTSDSLTVSVEDAPNLSVTYSVDETTVEVGQQVTVTATVSNTGGVEGNRDLQFLADGTQFHSETVTVPPNDATTVSATTSFGTTGSHTVSVDDQATTEITVVPADRFGLETTAESAAPNDSVWVNFTVTNQGDSPAAAVLNVTGIPSDWSIIDRVDAGADWNDDSRTWLWTTIDAGESASPGLQFAVPASAEPGEYTVTAIVDDRHGTATEQSVGIPVSDGTVTVSGESTSAAPNGTSTVTFTVENAGASDTAAILALEELPTGWTVTSTADAGAAWNDADRKWLWQTVPADSSVSPSATLAVPNDTEVGTYDVRAVLKRQSGTVDQTTVAVEITNESSSVSKAVAGSDGVIDDIEVLSAIDHWRSGTAVPGASETINDVEILHIIELWRSQTPV